MSAFSFRKNSILLALLLVTLSACNLPREEQGPGLEPGAIDTAAAQTVAVHLTAAAERGQAITTPTPEPVSQLTGTVSPPLETEAAGNTPDPEANSCDQIRFVKDVTVPDGTEFTPGEEFTKTWRLENAGTCSWTLGYSLVFDRGDALSGPAAVQLTADEIQPGETIDLSVDLVAPAEPGSYQGFWKLRNARGERFGVGEDWNPFWVQIEVVESTGSSFDFNQFANQALWTWGQQPVDYQQPGEETLTFGAEADSGQAFVTLKEDQRLEGGTISGWLLETFPPAVEGGYVLGQFPRHLVNPADKLTGRVGLLKNPGGPCGEGDVTYRIDYFVEGDSSSPTRLGEWREICDDRMKSFELALDDLAGQAVHFVLVVIANRATQENYAVWDSLTISR
ncbi:MAG: NBR1-Ig-like domain-containing protein [Anaerolineales bacterium]|nr:NBR1-Ig-like domain-containing protein [Anaerolineales bacterium]